MSRVRQPLVNVDKKAQYGRRPSSPAAEPPGTAPSSRKMMIVVTPNLCIDRTHWLDHFEPGTVNRPRRAEVAAGGKGVNVARALRDLGRAPDGARLPAGGGRRPARAAAARRGSGVRPWSRRRASCAPRSSSSRTAAGPPCSTSPARCWTPRTATPCWTGWRERLRATGARLVIGSGSLPPGLPADTYARLCRTAREHGAQVIVDAARDALAAVLAAEPDLVTPNLAEAEGLVSGVVVEASDARRGPRRDPGAGPGGGPVAARGGRPPGRGHRRRARRRLRRRRGRAVV